MAKFTEELPVELIRQFEELNLGATDMMKKMTEAGAKVVYTNVKSNLKKVLNRRTGDLEKSLIITRPYKNSKEEIATKVGFYGYDRNGIPNPLKAMAREYGTSNGEMRTITTVKSKYAMFTLSESDSGDWYFFDQEENDVVLYKLDANLANKTEVKRFPNETFRCQMENCSMETTDNVLYFYQIDSNDTKVLYRYDMN